MPFSQSRIANNLQQWNMNFELVNLALDAVSHSAGSWSVAECFGQFQHCSVHAANFFFDFLRVDISKWTFKSRKEKAINAFAVRGKGKFCDNEF